jgi:hypothetical protein
LPSTTSTPARSRSKSAPIERAPARITRAVSIPRVGRTIVGTASREDGSESGEVVESAGVAAVSQVKDEVDAGERLEEGIREAAPSGFAMGVGHDADAAALAESCDLGGFHANTPIPRRQRPLLGSCLFRNALGDRPSAGGRAR